MINVLYKKLQNRGYACSVCGAIYPPGFRFYAEKCCPQIKIGNTNDQDNDLCDNNQTQLAIPTEAELFLLSLQAKEAIERCAEYHRLYVNNVVELPEGTVGHRRQAKKWRTGWEFPPGLGLNPSRKKNYRLRTCSHCGHQWYLRKNLHLPKNCSKCGSKYWNEPKQKHVCLVCGHEWQQRYKERLPSRCPNRQCRSRRWDQVDLNCFTVKKEEGMKVQTVVHLRDQDILQGTGLSSVSLCFVQGLKENQLTNSLTEVTCKRCKRMIEHREMLELTKVA